MASTSQPLDPPKSPSTQHNSSSLSPTAKASSSTSIAATNVSFPLLSSATTTTIKPSTTTTTSPSSPPSPLTIKPLTHDNLPTYRRLLALLLPIPYRPSFSTEPLQSPSPCIALLAHWQPSPSPSAASTASAVSAASAGIIIGLIQARICPPDPHPNSHPTLYIQALGLLAPYRHLGVATYLLSELLARAREQEPRLNNVWAHVWEASEEALKWYMKRGFVVEEEIIRGYYRRLKPGGARVVRMMLLGEGDGVGES